MLKKKDSQNIITALQASLATIEFEIDGTILHANSNFLNVMGYSLDEIQGKHHSMFIDPEEAKSKDYLEFWDKLRKGVCDSKEYKRFAKGGRVVWIQATYNPIIDSSGKVYKIVKLATDITKQKLINADYEGQLTAVSNSQAIIEFQMDGKIITANRIFLETMGYTLNEIQGEHHRMFMDPKEAQSTEYTKLWERLNQGEYQNGEYKRIGKNRKEVWIQGSYTPIVDMNGKLFKIVKYATDITQQRKEKTDDKGKISAIERSQASIEFKKDGTILDANENFLNVLGYTLEEIKGQHHRMFIDPRDSKKSEYLEFWEKLNQGQYHTGEYKRFGKNNKEVWIQASYNPILDDNGKTIKIVKYATDITAQMKARLEAVDLTGKMSENIQTVSVSSEELLAAVNEISASMSSAQQAVQEIVSKAQYAGELSDDLQKTSNSMENMIALISDIAERVNLLALNATIEAARAGEAGKGFSVVAGEVKNLAKQTADATEQIAREISGIQDISGNIVNSNTNATNATESVSMDIDAVAAAIEEQTAATNDISSNMQEITDAVNALNKCIQKVG